MGNSVIYTPAYDAEVEYLESTGTQWIDTGVYGNDDTAIECKVYITNTSKKFNIVGARDGFTNTISIMYIPYHIVSDFKNVTEQDGRLSVNKSSITNNFIAYTSKSLRKIIDEYSENEWTLTQGVSGVSPSQSIKIGYSDANYSDSFSNAYMKLYYCKIWNGNTLIRDFIPVRIGPVGYLYDKVSKQLFANKGTGNFILGNDVSNAVIPQQRCVLYFGSQRSVVYERIYEEYHWLKGDGSAYISHPDIDDFEIETYSIDNTKVIYERGYRVGEPSQEVILQLGYGATLNFYSSLIISRLSGGTYANFRTNEISYGEHIIRKTSISENIGIFTDNVRHKKNSTSDLDYVGTEYVFNQLIPDFSTYIGYLSCASIHFIPCKLLVGIPAILDGNGIARQAGECGMWDKVTNKFYGNVSESGTFTVKGPKCYEEYNWLIGNRIDGNYAYMYGIEYDLWNNHLQMMIGQSRGGSNRFFAYTDENNCVFQMYRDNSTDKLNVVFRESSGTQHIADVSPYSEMSDGVEFDFYIENALSYCKKNGVIYTNNGNPTCTKSNWTSIHPTIYSAKMGYIREVLPDGTCKSNLVPCKLTHGIPASMDANGIPRPTGTCGMWDKVNDVFYGNVASSGSFTVSND